MKTGVILVTLGGPSSLDEVPEFITRFIGRELPPPAMNAVSDDTGLSAGFPRLSGSPENRRRR